jgi:hypothetical protein
MKETTIINAAISGGIAVAFGMIGVCFLRFWRSSRSRLFLLFGIAFFLLVVERLVLVLVNPDNELAPYIYSMRLLAFAVIIAAIVDQNRKGGGAAPT